MLANEEEVSRKRANKLGSMKGGKGTQRFHISIARAHIEQNPDRSGLPEILVTGQKNRTVKRGSEVELQIQPATYGLSRMYHNIRCPPEDKSCGWGADLM
jgi:hypothetical protein